jgi:hypothetical protein
MPSAAARVEVREIRKSPSAPAGWACRVTEGDALLFDSTWLSLRLASECAAQWLGDRVVRAHVSGLRLDPAGHGPAASMLEWQGSIDDFTATFAGIALHAEHLDGPLRGGNWWCAAGDAFNLADHPDIELRSASAAKWLAELIARSGSSL